MRTFIIVLLLLGGCRQKNDERDRGPAAASAQPAAQEQASLGAVVPAPARPAPPESPPRFGLDLQGQLDRIDAEQHALLPADGSQRQGIEGPEQERDDKAFGIKFDILRPQPWPVDILSFAARADASRDIPYLALRQHAGEPYMMKVKIWQIEVQQSPRPVVAAMCSFDFWGRAPIFVAGRMSAKYKVGDSVDVVGYLTEGHSYVGADGVHRTVPAVAAFAMVKGGSLKKVRALHGKNPAPRP